MVWSKFFGYSAVVIVTVSKKSEVWVTHRGNVATVFAFIDNITGNNLSINVFSFVACGHDKTFTTMSTCKIFINMNPL